MKHFFLGMMLFAVMLLPNFVFADAQSDQTCILDFYKADQFCLQGINYTALGGGNVECIAKMGCVMLDGTCHIAGSLGGYADSICNSSSNNKQDCTTKSPWKDICIWKDPVSSTGSTVVCSKIGDEPTCRKEEECFWLDTCRDKGVSNFDCTKLSHDDCNKNSAPSYCVLYNEKCQNKKDIVDGVTIGGDGSIMGGSKTFDYNILTEYSSRLNKIGSVSIQEFIGRIIKTAMGVMGSIALVMITYGGFLWMVEGANSEKAHKALMIILWSAMGLGVIFASYALVDLVLETFR